MELEALKNYYETKKNSNNEFTDVVKYSLILGELNDPTSPLAQSVGKSSCTSSGNIPMNDLITRLDGLRGTCEMNDILKWVGENVRLDARFFERFVSEGDTYAYSLTKYIHENFHGAMCDYLLDECDIRDFVEFK